MDWRGAERTEWICVPKSANADGRTPDLHLSWTQCEHEDDSWLTQEGQRVLIDAVTLGEPGSFWVHKREKHVFPTSGSSEEQVQFFMWKEMPVFGPT